MRRSDKHLNKIYIQTFYNISLSSIMRWYRGHIKGRFRSCRSRVTSPESYDACPFHPTVATINLTIVKGRLIHATLLSIRYSL